ncbi:septal ring lytic transglycosylase RlpA family protein [Pontibacter beigongshangensis]|uniref:septal ring lytic transglycosylase RlpA family protein n=1 Tax=Pontibacter beigongshangensis TaxID=2574733 RepID=UPI0016502855|nr:septal ring lytic transglycosylase RlpA family protein [Pontibacter beigongshangensis]
MITSLPVLHASAGRACTRWLISALLLTGMASCATRTAQFGQRGYTEEGQASYYSKKLQGRKMANGQPYRHNKLTAAHRTLPFGTRVKVTSLKSNKTVKVTITDRGPFVKGRVIDLSGSAASRLNAVQAGVVPVKVKVIRAASAR